MAKTIRTQVGSLWCHIISAHIQSYPSTFSHQLVGVTYREKTAAFAGDDIGDGLGVVDVLTIYSSKCMIN